MNEQPMPVDVAQVARDEELLVALGRGDPPPDGDDLATLLASWRADLVSDLAAPASAGAAPELPGAGSASAGAAPELPGAGSASAGAGSALPGARSAGLGSAPAGAGSALAGAAPELSSPALPGPAVPRRRGHRFHAVLAAAAVLVGIAGALTIAAGSAGPDSPLWPITRIVYEDRADSRVAQRDAERAIERARTAVSEARHAEAAALLDEATAAIGRVRDPRIVQRLLDEVRAVRSLLATAGGAPAVPGGVVPGGAPSTGGAGTGSGGPTPQPGPTPGGGAPTVPVPPLPLPTLPVPLPTLPTPPPLLPG